TAATTNLFSKSQDLGAHTAFLPPRSMSHSHERENRLSPELFCNRGAEKLHRHSGYRRSEDEPAVPISSAGTDRAPGWLCQARCGEDSIGLSTGPGPAE